MLRKVYATKAEKPVLAFNKLTEYSMILSLITSPPTNECRFCHPDEGGIWNDDIHESYYVTSNIATIIFCCVTHLYCRNTIEHLRSNISIAKISILSVSIPSLCVSVPSLRSG